MPTTNELRSACEAMLAKKAKIQAEDAATLAPLWINALAMTIDLLSDSGTDELERKALLAMLLKLQRLTDKRLGGIKPTLHIVVENGTIDQVLSDMPELVSRIFSEISVIDCDVSDDEDYPSSEILDAVSTVTGETFPVTLNAIFPEPLTLNFFRAGELDA